METREFSGKYAKRKALDYREFFRARWQEFIVSNFDSPEHVAVVFGVEGSTARKWYEGLHAPSGFAVGWAYEHYPEEAAATLRRVA